MFGKRRTKIEPPHAVELDSLSTPEQAAKWLGLTQRVLLANVRRKKIPAVRINDRVIRFHPRTILKEQGAVQRA